MAPVNRLPRRSRQPPMVVVPEPPLLCFFLWVVDPLAAGEGGGALCTGAE